MDCPRLFLHCRSFSPLASNLSLWHLGCRDLNGLPFVAEAPLPAELQDILNALRERDENATGGV